MDLEVIDRAVTRVITTKMRLGLFEEPYVDPTRAEVPSDEDRAVALEIAQKSIVLLRNEGILPLRSDIGTIAVIGPNADSARNLVGDYGHIVHIETLREARGRGGVAGTAAPTDLPLTDELAGWPTILSAIRGAVADSTDVRFARGCGLLDGGESEMEDAVEAASGADVAVLVLGERSGLTDDCTCGEARDRLDLGLPGRQAELFARVAATGTPIVLVLVAGRPLAIPREAVQSAAVLAAWVPGECGPAAVADVLFGKVSPSGRLPVTVPRHVGQVPIFYAHKPSGGRSNWRDDYVDGSHEPLWPFGFGLSYSDFRISDLRLGAHAVPTNGEIVATVTVTNVGEREADEVVQLYVRDEHASVTRPVKELRGFTRVRLLPGEAADVTFRVAAEQLAFTDVDGRLVVEPGTIRVMVGRSSVDLPCRAELELIGERRSVADRTHFFSGVSVGVPTKPDGQGSG